MQTTETTIPFSEGMRVSARGEDFLITDTDPQKDGTCLLTVEGISELVKGQTFVFDTAIDTSIVPLDPGATRLVADHSQNYRRTKLFIETQLRHSTLYHKQISIAHQGAFAQASYQYEPTLKALKQPRPRILIADGVGLGKTIEVGILLAELIKRGRGKRILVLALKSILGQFQQELWHRFAIPLVRLDSQGIAQLKTELPAHKNPFNYYDKTIVSIDTLKNNAKFRHHIEKTRWDVVVIDECHTVANIKTQRGELAQDLSGRCESLILTSATPHNGKAESFANLIRMIEPTAIPRSGAYTKQDVEPYYVRRFKLHLEGQGLENNFREREVVSLKAALYPEEEAFLQRQQAIKFEALSQLNAEELPANQGKATAERQDLLFSFGLFKAYLSSPRAAYTTLQNRIATVQKKGSTSGQAQDDLALLQELASLVKTVLDHKKDAKYDRLCEQLRAMKWKGAKKDPRIVLFAERLDTLHYLKERLTEDFGLDESAIGHFHGSLTDMEQQAMVEDFGKEDSDYRLFLTSDAGAQGVNLHYYCHHMVNYDVPWSLITLEQRNGRIDRFGQQHTPYIYYVLAASQLEGVKTDLAIVEKLKDKEVEVQKVLGDAASVLKLYDAAMEERVMEQALEQQDASLLDTAPAEEAADEDEEFDLSLLFGGESDATPPTPIVDPIRATASLYPDEGAYYRELIDQLVSEQQFTKNEARFVDKTYLELVNTEELDRVLYDLPRAAKPAPGELYRLTLDRELVEKKIAEARKRKGEWAQFQLLYDLHPVVRYLMTKLEATLDKGTAPVARLSQIDPGVAWYLLHGQATNKLGQSVVSKFFAMPFSFGVGGGLRGKPLSFDEFVQRFDLKSTQYTQSIHPAALEALEKQLPLVLEFANDMYMMTEQTKEWIEMKEKVANYEKQLQKWLLEAERQLEVKYSDPALAGPNKHQKALQEKEIQRINDEGSQYSEDMKTLGQNAYLQVVAVFYNEA